MSTLIGMLTLATMLGALLTQGLRFVGLDTQTPEERFAALAHADSVQMYRIDTLVLQLNQINELQLRMAAMRCLDPGDARRVIAAQMPCGRIIRVLELKP